MILESSQYKFALPPLTQEIMGYILRKLDPNNGYAFLATSKAANQLRPYVISEEANRLGYRKEDGSHCEYIVRLYTVVTECLRHKAIPKNCIKMKDVKYSKGTPTKKKVDLFGTITAILSCDSKNLSCFFSSTKVYDLQNICLFLRQFSLPVDQKAIPPETIEEVINKKNTEVLSALLGLGANPNDVDYLYIHQAVKSRDVKAVEVLMKAGANPDSVLKVPYADITEQDSFGLKVTYNTSVNYNYFTPLELAIDKDYVEMVKVLLTKCNPNKIGNPNSDTLPFYRACKRDRVSIVKLFLDCVPDCDLNKGLEWSVQYNSYDCTALFLNKPVDPNLSKLNGEPLLCVAVKMGDLKAVKLLVGSKINLECNTLAGETPLYCAVMGSFKLKCERIEMVKTLVEAGANAQALGPTKNMSIIQHANTKRSKKIYNYLLNRK